MLSKVWPLAAAASMLLSAPLAQAPELPSGCVEEEGAFVCQWIVETTSAPAEGQHRFAVPVHARTLANVTLIIEGADAGWEYSVIEVDTGRVLMLNGQAPDPGIPVDTRNVVASSFFTATPDAAHEFQFNTTYFGGIDGLSLARSAGTFRIEYRASQLPEGTPPTHPAATSADPHLLDEVGDAAYGDVDLDRVWFDDAGLDDGVFEIHVRVRDLRDAGPPPPEAAAGRDTSVTYTVDFRLSGRVYRTAIVTDRGEATPPLCRLVADPTATSSEPLPDPRCEADRPASTFVVHMLESSVGSPGPGVLFQDMLARASVTELSRFLVDAATTGDPTETQARVEDEAPAERYPFALGGPHIWQELNPRLRPVAAAPWYAAPLAPENVPNTLQVLGALFATGAFLLGLVLVRARRRRVRHMLAEVDAALEAHAADPAAALAALAALEASFDARLRRGRMTDAEYQIVSQRIATSATRVAMRRDQVGVAAPIDATPGRLR